MCNCGKRSRSSVTSNTPDSAKTPAPTPPKTPPAGATPQENLRPTATTAGKTSSFSVTVNVSESAPSFRTQLEVRAALARAAQARHGGRRPRG